MKKRIFYDDSLREFAFIIGSLIGMDSFEKNFFLRDAKGKLTFVLRENITEDSITSINNSAKKRLHQYIDEDFAVSHVSELFDDELEHLELTDDYKKVIMLGDDIINIFYIERRIIGGDWQRYFADYKGPARLVFSSIKGGVGRTTALCVIATSLARSGKRVLAIDLDLEAPGLGNMLLTEDTLPELGLLDYFVEKNLNNFYESDLVDLIGSSWLSDGKGKIDVIPAIGKKSIQNPQNVIGKISRAYLSRMSENGSYLTIMDNLRDLLSIFNRHRYDAILIDARAGLHETTAAALVGLGAEVFCFGVDQSQTLQGYELLFASIAENKASLSEINGWIDHLHFVHAKASLEKDKRDIFASKINDLAYRYFVEHKKDKSFNIESDILSLKDSFEVTWADSLELDEQLLDGLIEEPIMNEVLAVLNDNRFTEFDPLLDRDSLSESVYNVTFGSIIKKAKLLVEQARS